MESLAYYFCTWIKDYIFIPLGGSKSNVYRNLILTFTLGGFWHGASINFLLWGFLMGFFLSIEYYLNTKKILNTRAYNFPYLILVWILYLSIGVFFFAPNFTWGILAIQKMFSFQMNVPILNNGSLQIIFFAFLIVMLIQSFEFKEIIIRFPKRYESYFLFAMYFFFYLYITQRNNVKKDFFYFQF